MALAHQLDTDPGVQRLYSVALEIWNPRKREWEAKIDTCHAWNAQDAKMKIMASYPNRYIRVAIAGVTLGFFVNDNHGEDLEV
jgi:hypothetical protein